MTLLQFVRVARLTDSANPRTKATAPVSGKSPGAARSVASTRCFRRPAHSRVLRETAQHPGLMSYPRLRDPVPKSRCVRRELYPEGASYRPTGSRSLRDNCGRNPPSRLAGRTAQNHPLLTGSSAAGEASGPRYGQGSYTELKSVASTPHPSPDGEGRLSGKETHAYSGDRS